MGGALCAYSIFAFIGKRRTQRDRKREYRSNGENVSKCLRYADDMVFVLKPEDDAGKILAKIEEFLAERGMNVSQKKTKVTASIDGFDFLGWNFYVQRNNKKLRKDLSASSIPSADNFKAFYKEVKNIVNNSNDGAETKVVKLAPIVRGWRNYHVAFWVRIFLPKSRLTNTARWTTQGSDYGT